MLKVRASQIFSHSVDDAVAAKKLLDSGTPFSEVVQKFSTCPSKENGGDLGWMPEGSVNSLLGEAVTEKDQGRVLGPIHSQYGYHILLISEVRVEQTPGPFTPETPMTAVVDSVPDAGTLLFRQFQIGLPVTGYRAEETIRSVAEGSGKPLIEVLNFLNAEHGRRQLSVITPEELRDKLASGDPPALLDIREQWERDIAIIENAQDISRDNCETVLNSLDKNREIVLIDWKQDRGPSFQKWMSQRGFTQVKCLEGGIDAWARKIDTGLALYEIDEDDGYRYEDIIQQPH